MENDKTMRESDEIWKEIRNIDLPMFGIQGRKIDDYCERIDCSDRHLFVKTKVSSVLPALETALVKGFTVELTAGFIVIKRK